MYLKGQRNGYEKEMHDYTERAVDMTSREYDMLEDYWQTRANIEFWSSVADFAIGNDLDAEQHANLAESYEEMSQHYAEKERNYLFDTWEEVFDEINKHLPNILALLGLITGST